MKHKRAGTIFLAAVALPLIAFGLPPTEPDPHGIVIRPIPEKLVVLTFDDACRSHASLMTTRATVSHAALASLPKAVGRDPTRSGDGATVPTAEQMSRWKKWYAETER